MYPTAVCYSGQAARLFVETYMTAAKVMGCPRLMSFWQRVSGDRYSCEQLLKMQAQFRQDLLGYVDIEPCTFDWFKTHLEAYSTTDDAREFAGVTAEHPMLCSDPPPGYTPGLAAQPSSYIKHGEPGVNSYRTILDGEVLELLERLPRSR